MSYETECDHCNTKLVVIGRQMGVPGGLEMEEGDCPLCGNVVARIMTDGFISVKLTEKQHQLLQTIFNASRWGHSSPPDVVDTACSLIAAGFVKQSGNDLHIPAEVQQALARIHQPLKV
ncbi:MAG: hypothetical protein K2X55_07585 [Burkholderiaceae bacterium]|nr:hypothetical protein [Burkholderiaceae bacterium]